MKKKSILFGMILVLCTGLTAGCGDSSSAVEQNEDGVTVVRAAGQTNYYPLVYLNDDGEMEGFSVDVINAVDEILTEYTWELVSSSGDEILMGLEQGKYDAAIGGYFYNEERAEKFIYPEYNGGSIECILTTKEHEDVKTIADAVEQNLKIAPTLSYGGLIGALKDYNAENPDAQLTFDTIDERTDFEIWTDIVNGRYDFDVVNLHTYNQVVEDNPDSDVAKETVINPFQAVKSYDLFNKDNQELADAYSEAIRQLKEDGTLSEIYVKWFGEDIFPYFDDSIDSEYGKANLE